MGLYGKLFGSFGLRRCYYEYEQLTGWRVQW